MSKAHNIIGNRLNYINYMTGIETILKIAGVGILATVINSILEKSDKRELATFVTLTALVVVLIMVISLVSELLGTVQNLFGLF